MFGFIYCMSFTLASTIQITHPIIIACVHGNDGPPADFKVIGKVGIPYDIFIISSIVLDASTYIYIKKRTSPQTSTESNAKPDNVIEIEMTEISADGNTVQSEVSASAREGISVATKNEHQTENTPTVQEVVKTNDTILDIPLKATIMSSAFAVPSLFLGILATFLSFTPIQKNSMVYMAILALASLRIPAIILATFKRNALNQATDRALEREKKRQIEIDHALQERERRRMAWEP